MKKRLFYVSCLMMVLLVMTACGTYKESGSAVSGSFTRNGNLSALSAPDGWEMGETNKLVYVYKNESLPNGKAPLTIRIFDARSADGIDLKSQPVQDILSSITVDGNQEERK